MSESEMQALQAQVFCMAYELKVVGEQLVDGRLERWLPGFTALCVEAEHVQRYEHACQFSKGKKVLDIACGTGRGSRMLYEVGGAKEVIAVDIDPDALRYARIKNPGLGIRYLSSDGQALPFEQEFDLIVSFETVEHVDDPLNFLIGLSRALKPGGLLVISTPISHKSVDIRPNNPYHKQEWGLDGFRELLERSFVIERVYAQFRPPLRPSFLRRLLSKLGVAAVPSPYPRASPPLWQEINDKPIRVVDFAYQVLHCRCKT